ncbi:IQ calmodulin-binding protein, putative [Bodo saltans]|uniref:IQ calmodulin-binding protein, putative n=1 Tax=Bodo saltans TaxID=75058 RepID=A0A0S4J2M8_BODSA|nr:IQ calmodulin-binding protein, putative [Bodo saltans]|eukprot:CUG69916.1 IQ calmodulin-binding protein, putative [Bodo saltans]
MSETLSANVPVPAAPQHPGIFTKRESIEDAILLERQAVELENQGQDLPSIRCMERALLLRCRDGGAVDEACLSAAERLVVKCNTVAVKSFKADDYVTACTLLDNALRVTDGDTEPLRGFDHMRQKLRGTTLNNYGCLERRRGHLQESLQLLTMSLDFAGQQSPATYLNISAICSQIGRQDEAVGHARRAIGLLERLGDTSGMLAIANHNLATALESIDPTASEEAYNVALKIATESFGHNSPTTQSIHRNMQRFHQRAKTVKPITLPPIQSSTNHPRTTAGDGHHNLSAGRVRSPPQQQHHHHQLSRKGVSPQQSPIPQQRLGTSSSTSSMPPARISGRLPAMVASSSPAPPSAPRQPQQRPQTEPGGRKPPIGSRPTTGDSLADSNRPAATAALHPRPPPGEKRREAFGPNDKDESAVTSSTRSKDSKTTTSKKPTAAATTTTSISRENSESPAVGTRRESSSVTPTTSPSTKELKVALTPQNRDLATPTTGRGGLTPRGASRLTPTTKAGGNTPTSNSGGPAGELLDVLPTLPQKTEDLATFMVTRLGTLLAAEEKFEQMYRQVVKIQCMYRRFRSRKELQRRRDARRRQARLHEITLHSAAKRIQRFLKANMRRRVLHQAVAMARQIDTDKKSKSAVVIQKVARRWLARRLVKAKRKLKHASLNATLTLQRWFRKELAIRHVASLHVTADSADIAWIQKQKHWAAATRIQAGWRAAMARDATRDLRGTAMAARDLARRNRCTTAAVKVQSWWRGLMARRAYATKHAARLLHREKLRAVERRRVSTTKLQGFARGIICRNRTAPLLEAQANARIARQEAKRQLAALRLQSWVRMFVAQARYAMMKTRRALALRLRQQDALVRRIQRHLRSYGARRALGKKFAATSVNRQQTTVSSIDAPAQPAAEIVETPVAEIVVVVVEAPPSAPAASVDATGGSSSALPLPDASAVSDASPVDGSSMFSATDDSMTVTSRLREPSPTCVSVTPISPYSGGPLPDIVADADLPTGRTPLRDGAINPPNREHTASGLDIERPLTPVNGSSAVEDDDESSNHKSTPQDETPIVVEEVAEAVPEVVPTALVTVEITTPAASSETPAAATEERIRGASANVASLPSAAESQPLPPPAAKEQKQQDDQEDCSIWNFKPRPPPPRRFGDKHKVAGATLVRVARGFLGRLYAKNVSCIVHEYIERLIERHVDSPNKAAMNQRPMVHTLLERFENDENVAKAKQKLLVADLADEVLEFALNTSNVPHEEYEDDQPLQDIVVAAPTPTGSEDDDNCGDRDESQKKKRHDDDEERHLAALLVMQRSIRMLLAKCKLARLREARRLRWEERREQNSFGDNVDADE